jgi:para-nitrobenzyl esterase
VPFAFNMLDNPQARGFVGEDPPQGLADATHEAWVGFVTDGDPNVGALPDWPRYDPDQRPTMLLDEVCALANRPADEQLALWDGVI